MKIIVFQNWYRQRPWLASLLRYERSFTYWHYQYRWFLFQGSLDMIGKMLRLSHLYFVITRISWIRTLFFSKLLKRWRQLHKDLVVYLSHRDSSETVYGGEEKESVEEIRFIISISAGLILEAKPDKLVEIDARVLGIVVAYWKVLHNFVRMHGHRAKELGFNLSYWGRENTCFKMYSCAVSTSLSHIKSYSNWLVSQTQVSDVIQTFLQDTSWEVRQMCYNLLMAIRENDSNHHSFILGIHQLFYAVYDFTTDTAYKDTAEDFLNQISLLVNTICGMFF